MRITIEGVLGASGEYEMDESYFTNRELHTIKQIAGVRAGELSDAISAGDSDLIVALAAITLERNGKKVPVDMLWDAPAGKIMIEATPSDGEGDALPPETPSGNAESDAAKSAPSGASSKPSGVPQASDRSPTGTPA